MKKIYLLTIVFFATITVEAQFKKLQFEDNTSTNYLEYDNNGQLKLGVYGDFGRIGKISLRGTRNGLVYGQGGELEFGGGFGTRADILMKYTGGHEQTWLGITSSDSSFPLKVGIGKNNPSSELDVNGEIKANTVTLGEYGDNGHIGKISLRGTRNNLVYGQGGELEFGGGFGTRADILMKFTGGHEQTWLGITSTDSSYPLRVGIGTTTPDSELTVKGTIHTNEVKVDLQGAVGPDYVFESDYELRTLEETETYIKENCHLPEIPSAYEMEKDGVNLKEMNLKLLKKVEELTLYMIEMNKAIKGLKEDNQALKSEVFMLRKGK